MGRRNRFGNGDGNCVLYWIIGLAVVCFLFCKKKSQFGMPDFAKMSQEEKDKWKQQMDARFKKMKKIIIK
jgi:hypothetical protein